MTSAGCVSGIKPSELNVRAGSEYYNRGGVKAEVTKIIPHKKYNESAHDYDLAVLKLKGCLATSTSNIEEITISQTHNSAKEGLLSGWVNGEVNGVGLLQLHRVNVYRRSECQVVNITKRMLCARTMKDERCVDFLAGSPLVAEGKLIGIKSFGFPCSQTQPDIFTNIYVIFKFIQKVIKRFA